MVTLYLNGNPPWLKVFGDDQKPRVVVVTVLTSLILLLYDGLMVSHVPYNLPRMIMTIIIKNWPNALGRDRVEITITISL